MASIVVNYGNKRKQKQFRLKKPSFFDVFTENDQAFDKVFLYLIKVLSQCQKHNYIDVLFTLNRSYRFKCLLCHQ